MVKESKGRVRKSFKGQGPYSGTNYEITYIKVTNLTELALLYVKYNSILGDYHNSEVLIGIISNEEKLDLCILSIRASSFYESFYRKDIDLIDYVHKYAFQYNVMIDGSPKSVRSVIRYNYFESALKWNPSNNVSEWKRDGHSQEGKEIEIKEKGAVTYPVLMNSCLENLFNVTPP